MAEVGAPAPKEPVDGADDCLDGTADKALDGLSEADNRLARHHRAVLDDLMDLGYEREAVDEIEGCCSAAGLGDEEDLGAFPVHSPEDEPG